MDHPKNWHGLQMQRLSVVLHAAVAWQTVNELANDLGMPLQLIRAPPRSFPLAGLPTRPAPRLQASR